MSGRTLRSKRLRYALWKAAEGRCQRCGHELGPDWEADHRVSWATRERTNVHEMQALCRRCNREKADLSLRKHQLDLQRLCRDIRARVIVVKRVLVIATPAAGKSPLPAIAAKELIPSFADRICWVVPRMSLQEQGEQTFLAPWLRQLIDHRSEIRRAANDPDPSRDKIGYVTTYQAIAANPALHADEFDRFRYILVLDENHHLDEGGVWARALQRMIDKAALVIMMTGTLERSDEKPLAFIPRRPVHKLIDGRVRPGWEYDLANTSELQVIRYPRTDALQERAVRRLEFVHIDGFTTWIEKDGQAKVMELGIAGQDVRKAIWTAVNTQIGEQILELSHGDWRAYRAQKPEAKLLVVAANIVHAKAAVKSLSGAGVPRVGIATSDESEAAEQAIRHFKLPYTSPGALDVLVTVQIAYEGLDVPEITHIASLTHIRSVPWIFQMISRAARVCPALGDWNSQVGFIYGPNDELFRQIAVEIRLEQDPFVSEPTGESGGGAGGGLDEPDRILPVSSIATKETVAGLEDGRELTPYQVARIRVMMSEYGIVGSIRGAFDFLKAHGVELAPQGQTEEPEPPVVPPSLRESALRGEIETYCRRYDRECGLENGSLNRHLFGIFGKPRRNMSESELREVWHYLQTKFALESGSYAGLDLNPG